MKAEQATLTPVRRRAVDQLLIRYLELPEKRQAAWLADIRRRLPRLAGWLERLIDNNHTITLLDKSVRKLAGESIKGMEVSTAHLAPGDRLGPWEVIEEVGQGGMGRVYRGQRADGAFEMDVAIKQIGHRRRGLAELLQRECQLLAKLDHPSVTRLVDAGLDDRAGPFLVMEWIEGTDLADWLTANQPDLDSRLALFEQIAEAVAHAHQRLIVHGDIKPNNIRVRDDGTVKLMDFGVARLLDPSEMDQPEPRALTPAFAAPEQRAGEDITPASDIWSLGALLFWLLDFGPSRAKATDLPSGLMADSSLHHKELAAIINKARNDSPGNRYQTVGEFLADLIRQRRHEPVSVLPATHAYRLRRFVRRNPTLVGGIGASFFALSVGLVIAAWMYVEAEQAREQAVSHALEAEQVAGFQAEQINRLNLPGLALSLNEQLHASGYQIPSDDEYVDLTEILMGLIDEHLLSTTAEATRAYFADQPLVKIRLLQSLVGSQRVLGLYDRAAEAQADVDRLIDEHAPVDHPVHFSAAHLRGLIESELGQLDEGLESIRQALSDRERVLGPNHPDTINSRSVLAVMLTNLGQYDKAESLYRQTLESRKMLLGEDHPDTLRTIRDIGALYRFRNDLDQAEAWLLQALEGMRQVLGTKSQLTASTTGTLGLVYQGLGQLDKAEDLLTESLRLNTAMLGANHHATLISRNNLGVHYQVKGDFDSAAHHYDQALQAYLRMYGELHRATLYARSNLGTALYLKGDLEAAEHHLWRATEGRTELFGDDHPDTLVSMSTLARLLVRQGDGQQALRLTNHIYQVRRRLFGEDNPATLIAMSHRGEALRATGSLDEAYAVTREAVELAATVLPEGHWRLASHQAHFARALKAMGRYEEAIAEVEQARNLAASGLGSEHPFVKELGSDLSRWIEQSQ